MNGTQPSRKDVLKAVLAYLDNDDVATICEEHKISQASLDHWTQRFMTIAREAFLNDLTLVRDQRLQEEIKELKEIIGELTVEVRRLRRRKSQ